MALRLLELYDLQKELDQRIIEEKGLDGIDLIDFKILALMVEIGEMINEWKQFKFWKEKTEFNRDRLLEEYADCLHFVLSIGNSLGQVIDFDFEELNAKYIYSDKRVSISYFMRIYQLASTIKVHTSHYVLLVYHFLDLGIKLDFSWDQISSAYKKKNKVNHERQSTHY